MSGVEVSGEVVPGIVIAAQIGVRPRQELTYCRPNLLVL